jgi:hypothetical protein
LAGIAAAKLERERVLGRIVGEQPRTIAMEHRPSGDPFGVDPRAPREQPMEEPAMPVGPFHHRCDAETMVHVGHPVDERSREVACKI